MTNLPEGNFKAELTLGGGTGRTTVQSPADVRIENGVITAEIIWSSPNYDLMIVDGKEYTPTSVEGGARFTVEIPSLDTPLDIRAETVAMSAPKMIDYTLTVSGREILENRTGSQTGSLTESLAVSLTESASAASVSEDFSVDISSILESLANKSDGSVVTVYSAVVGSEPPAASTGLPPFVTMLLGAAAGAAIAFAGLAIEKKIKNNKKK